MNRLWALAGLARASAADGPIKSGAHCHFSAGHFHSVLWSWPGWGAICGLPL